MTIMAKKKKKKGRPSLLDLQKRSLKQQQKQSQSPILFDFSPNPSGQSNRRSDGGETGSPAAELIAGEDDDERKEKKHRLVLGLDSDSEGNKATLSFNGEDLKRRSNYGSVKGLKATENSVGNGPTETPLPDIKLLVFILDRLQKKDTYGVFSDPVDPEELPDYHEIIQNPMDFGTVRKKLRRGAYCNLEQFESDVLLICSNAMEYNSPDTTYFRQAKSMQELAKKDFENLREESEDDSELAPPKIPRRGRPPGKKVKKSTEISPFELAGPQSLSVEETENPNGYNLRKNPPANKFRAADSVVNGSLRVSLGNETYPSSVYDWESEFPASVLRSVQKYGMKHFSVDENKRDSYRFSSSSRDEPTAFDLFDGGPKQLVEVGDAFAGYSYAQSLSRFAQDLGPVVRKIASRKIESILLVQSEASRNQDSLPKKVLADDLSSRLLSHQSASSSEPIQGLNKRDARFPIQQNSILQPSVSNGYRSPNIPPQMIGIFSNEANRLDSGKFLPQGNAVGSHGAPKLGTMQHSQRNLQPLASGSNAGFWRPDSPSSVSQIGLPQQPDLALQLRMGW